MIKCSKALGEIIERIKIYFTPSEMETVNVSHGKLIMLEEMEEQGRLVILPCKVGDTAWFYLYEDRCYLHKGIYQGVITELKSVQRLDDTSLILAVIEYEYPDPWYSEKMAKNEMHCSLGTYGACVQFYLTREEAETACQTLF